jgi:hypothetical protein
VPGINWGPDNKIIYTVTHAPASGQVSAEDSPFFDMSALVLTGGLTVNLVSQSGMFSYPVTSPIITSSGYQVAFLQAIFPAQSTTSRYVLKVMNKDGKDLRSIFPAEGQTGLQPQTPVWAPHPLDTGTDFIAVIYEGNLWLVDTASDQSQQVTGDGLTSQIDWK